MRTRHGPSPAPEPPLTPPSPPPRSDPRTPTRSSKPHGSSAWLAVTKPVAQRLSAWLAVTNSVAQRLRQAITTGGGGKSRRRASEPSHSVAGSVELPALVAALLVLSAAIVALNSGVLQPEGDRPAPVESMMVEGLARSSLLAESHGYESLSREIQQSLAAEEAEERAIEDEDLEAENFCSQHYGNGLRNEGRMLQSPFCPAYEPISQAAISTKEVAEHSLSAQSVPENAAPRCADPPPGEPLTVDPMTGHPRPACFGGHPSFHAAIELLDMRALANVVRHGNSFGRPNINQARMPRGSCIPSCRTLAYETSSLTCLFSRRTSARRPSRAWRRTSTSRR